MLVGRSEAGERLDQYLLRHLPLSVSRGMIQRSILEGAVTVSERPVKAHRRVRAGEVVIARCHWLPAPLSAVPSGTGRAGATPRYPAAQPIPLDVVYEDAALLVINKPAGLVTHPAPGHWDGTLVNAVLWHLQEGEGSRVHRVLPRAGIVHRLDKGTSGLLLVAKTEPARFHLSKQLKDRTISRRYLALVEGEVALDQGTIRASIGRHQRHRKRMTVRHLGGRTAVSHYRVLKRFRPQDAAKGTVTKGESPLCHYTLLEVSLETGRTHQVRVHVAHLGHPVVGDATYGSRTAGFWAALGISRPLLHAFHLTLRHPTTNQPLTFTVPPPHDMLQWAPGV